MKVVVQRVKQAFVEINGAEKARIKKGFVLLCGIAKGDDERDVEYMAEKISRLRIFQDELGKMNLSIIDVGAEILSVSQFTLLGETSKGNRPGFEKAETPDRAKELWKSFNDILREKDITVKEGEFGAYMQINLINDGPVTFIIESRRR